MSGLHVWQCSAFGVEFVLAAESDALLARMLKAAPLGSEMCGAGTEIGAGGGRRFALTRSAGGEGFRLAVDDVVVAEAAELEAVVEEFARAAMVHVAEGAPNRVFVHAGVVGWEGRALVLPGTSFAGKTTLVAELVRSGAVYYSDEYAVVDEHGWVHPYARELQMRVPGGVRQTPVAVEDLRGRVGVASLRAAYVAFVEYAEGGEWAVEHMPAGMAALEMMRHAIPVRRTPGRVMATLAAMMEGAVAVRSVRGEVGAAAEALLAAMCANAAEVVA